MVFAGPVGLPTEASRMTFLFKKLIKENDLPPVVFHSLRHSSITYKLKLNGGDVKAVQGDSGHAQASMVTEVYSHIMDEDRKRNAKLFEKEFYSGKRSGNQKSDAKAVGQDTAGAADLEMLMKLLSNPEMVTLLKTMVNTMGK